ncbi:MAG: hypothetical protein J2P48_07395 [Alphaproteobacteria bacterium]|nr:hypothetical protein [Alphaproteobacteria bacterium]
MGAAVIRIADWVIAWEKADRNHVHRREVDIAFVDDMITFIGRHQD